MTAKRQQLDAKTLRAFSRAAILRLARKDPAVFCEYVLRDEETGQPIGLTDEHVLWHRLMSEHRRLLIWSHVESGKTVQVAGRILWTLGVDPNARIAFVSNTAEQAEKVIRSIATYIEQSKELHEVFPKLRRSLREKDPWTSKALTIDRPNQTIRDPSLQGCGAHGNILGARLDYLFVDDILDYENTRTEHQRDELYKWFKSTLLGRLTRKSRVVINGNAYHADDLMHRLEKESDVWFAYRAPIRKNGKSIWPERWPENRIEEKIKELGPVEAARQLFCVPVSDATSRFPVEAIEAALDRGRGEHFTHRVDRVPPNARIYVGIDPAFSRKKRSDLTGMVALMVFRGNPRVFRVLAVESGKYKSSELIRRSVSMYERYRGELVVESVAAQQFFADTLSTMFRGLPVRKVRTNAALKYHQTYGIEALAASLSRDIWILPEQGGKELHALIDEMKMYSPESHTGDRLMALWLAWQQAVRDYGSTHKRIDSVELKSAPHVESVQDIWDWVGTLSPSTSGGGWDIDLV